MAVTDAPTVELATTPRRAADYPNIRLVDSAAASPADIPRPTAAGMLFLIEVIRRAERWLLDNAGLVPGPLHSSIGQEAVAAGTALALAPQDRLTSTHRAHHDVLARLITQAAPAGWDPALAGESPVGIVTAVRRTVAEVMGLAEGLCGGRGGSMHLADPTAGVATSAIVAGGIPAAAGGALASRLRGDGGVAVAVVGDGGTSIGAFHESLALARAWDLPLVTLVQNNRYSVATTLTETAGFEELAIRAAGYDMPALIVDGMDPVAVLAAMVAARARAASSGPVLVEALTYRFFHQNGPLPGSSFKYRTKQEEDAWASLDPATVFPARLVESGVLTAQEVEHVRALAADVVARAVEPLVEHAAEGITVPDDRFPSHDTVEQGILGPGLPAIDPELLDPVPGPDATEVTYVAAASGVIARCLERDPEAFVLGEEVGHLGGGVAGLTKGALAVAPERVLSTPICENGFTGAAFGAALAGMHPIVEFMYPDFTLEAADQLFNHVARARYMYGGSQEVPIVVRTQIARGRGYGPQHSCDPAALFALFPGWRIAAPATPADYVGLFNAAMLTRDPVLVIDDFRLLKRSGPLPPAGYDHVVRLGSGRLARGGRDVTVVAWGHTLHRVLAIAGSLSAEEGIEVEVIDPRWLDKASFDRSLVIASVARTGALVVVEDATRSHSMGAAIIDDLLPDLFGSLRTAPLRVTGADVYTPVSKPLEAAVNLCDEPVVDAIVRAARAARTQPA
jgi:2-oxoisovalerate dehydrogenase E1 component